MQREYRLFRLFRMLRVEGRYLEAFTTFDDIFRENRQVSAAAAAVHHLSVAAPARRSRTSTSKLSSG
jgi:hypothetical protein